MGRGVKIKINSTSQRATQWDLPQVDAASKEKLDRRKPEGSAGAARRESTPRPAAIVEISDRARTALAEAQSGTPRDQDYPPLYSPGDAHRAAPPKRDHSTGKPSIANLR